MEIINLTGEKIVLVNLEHEGLVSILTLNAGEDVATANKGSIYLGDIKTNGVEVAETEIYYTDIKGLPEPKNNKIYLVNEYVARAAPERRDLRVPTNPLYDENNEVVSYRSISRLY